MIAVWVPPVELVKSCLRGGQLRRGRLPEGLEEVPVVAVVVGAAAQRARHEREPEPPHVGGVAVLLPWCGQWDLVS